MLEKFVRRIPQLLVPAMAVVFLTEAATAGPVFDYTGSIVTYTITESGAYLITAYGGQGGSTSGGSGGMGAEAAGEFLRQAGDVLNILVAGAGTSHGYAGSGGGSFVSLGDTLATSTLLVAAGGGGGAGPEKLLVNVGVGASPAG